MEQKSNGATDGQSDGAKSDGAISLYIKTEKRKRKKSKCVGSYGWSERATERRSNGALEQQSVGVTEQISDGATERRSDGAIKKRFRDD